MRIMGEKMLLRLINVLKSKQLKLLILDSNHWLNLRLIKRIMYSLDVLVLKSLIKETQITTTIFLILIVKAIITLLLIKNSKTVRYSSTQTSRIAQQSPLPDLGNNLKCSTRTSATTRTSTINRSRCSQDLKPSKGYQFSIMTRTPTSMAMATVKPSMLLIRTTKSTLPTATVNTSPARSKTQDITFKTLNLIINRAVSLNKTVVSLATAILSTLVSQQIQQTIFFSRDKLSQPVNERNILNSNLIQHNTLWGFGVLGFWGFGFRV